MKLKILSKEFYDIYADCKEILKKTERPYACFTLEVDGILFAIPFRHHIHHRFSFHTLGEAGLDYTKTVVISENRFLTDDRPTIESKEFAIIKRNEQKIRYGFKQYLNQYRRAMKHRDNPRSANILRYSSFNTLRILFSTKISYLCVEQRKNVRLTDIAFMNYAR